MTGRSIFFVVVATGILVSSLGTPAMAATPAEVDNAIKQGVKYLYSIQKPDGTWEGTYTGEDFNDQDAGMTSIMVYTLLTAGESEKDPRLDKAIKYVIKADTKAVYALGFQVLALSKLTSSPEVKGAVTRVCKKLIAGSQRPNAIGLYRYQLDDIPASWDHSASQYAALGIWACGEAGIEIPDKVWEDIDKAWRRTQSPDGGWNYHNYANVVEQPKLAMTAAGVATLFITDEALSWKKAVDCKGNVADVDIDRGIKWAIAHINDPKSMYSWYGIERIAIASGYKYFGDVDWFKAGRDDLLKRQDPNGAWPWNYGPEAGTCFSVLFLVRGRAPVLMNKLRYDRDPTVASPVEGTWNQRPLDCAGAAAYVGKQLETFINWQVVNLNVDPDEWHDAPILYLAGFEALKFTPEQEAKLKKFVEDGGMIVGNADCASTAFSTSFINVCEKLFDKEYKFRTLPATHPIFTHEQFLAAKWASKPILQGMSNGVRELAILIPNADPSRAWQMRQFKSRHESYELVSDLYLYATDRQGINDKGVTWLVQPDKSITAGKTIKVARIQYAGNWNPEPSGWPRLSAVLHNSQKIDVDAEPVTLGAGKLAGYSIADLTGTDAITLDEAGRAEIKKFVTGGGTLIVDAAGGSTAFADSAQKELETIFGADAQQLQTPLPGSAAVLGNLPAADIKFRTFARSDSGLSHGSAIRAIQMNGRPAVLFSREDLSAGLVGENVDGILGYAPETATELMGKMVVFAAGTGK